MTDSTTRPEAGLHALRDRLYELLRALPVLDNLDLERKILPVLRKVEVARLLDEQYAVAVTGLQGVGKTTLIRAIYDIPKGILPEGVGRGEKVPVWIVECPEAPLGTFEAEVVEVSRPEGAEGPAELRTRAISTDELHELAQSPDPHHFLLKLFVPGSFFGGTSRSFLLLPGIEKRDTGWVELARHTLSCSDAALFVANSTVWARASAQKELEEVRSVLEGANPVFALTSADQSGDRNAEFAETVASDLDLVEDERDRLVVTDPDPRSSPDGDWRDRLRAALDRHAATTREARHRQLEHLESVLQGEVAEVLAEVDREAARKVSKLDASEYENVRHVTDHMEAEIAKLREAYASELESELDAYLGRARQSFEGGVQEESVWSKVSGLFGGKGLKDRAALRDAIAAAWAHPDGRDGDTPAIVQARALGRVVAPILPRHNALDVSGTAKRKNLLGTFETHEAEADPFAENFGSHALTREVLGDHEVLLSHDAHGEVSDNFRNSVAVLPALALETIRVGTLIPGLFDLEERAFAPADQIRHVGEEFGALKESHSGILKGVGGMLGLDFVADGELDIVSDLAAKAGAPAAAAGPIAFAVVGAVAVGYAAVSVGAAVNRADLDKAQRGSAALDEIADRTRARYLAEFDRVMGLLVEHVRNRLVGYYHLDRDYSRIARLHKAYADAREARYQLQDHVRPLLVA